MQKDHNVFHTGQLWQCYAIDAMVLTAGNSVAYDSYRYLGTKRMAELGD